SELLVVGLNDVFHDSQTKPSTTFIARPRLVDAVKSLGNPRQMFWFNAESGILHENGDLLAQLRGLLGANNNGTTRSVVFDGIFDEVQHNLANLVPVGKHRQRWIDILDFQRYLL